MSLSPRGLRLGRLRRSAHPRTALVTVALSLAVVLALAVAPGAEPHGRGASQGTARTPSLQLTAAHHRSGSVGAAKQYARRHLSRANWRALDHIARHESGWRKHASNPASGAYGIPQALPGRKMASAGPNWRNNAVTQVRWMIHYVNRRYGSAAHAWSFWRHHHWY